MAKYRRKRTMRKRKTYRKKKMFYRRRTGADRGHLEKITKHHVLMTDNAGAVATFCANWTATGAPAPAEAYFTGGGVNLSEQFGQCQAMYREYYISSMKIEYKPDFLDPGNANAVQISSIECGTVMDRLLAVPIGPPEIRGALDYKTFAFNRPFKRFYRVKQYARQKSLIWRGCTDATAGAAGGFNGLPNCQTVLWCQVNGLNPNYQIGTVTVTYYVKFHHRVRASN